MMEAQPTADQQRSVLRRGLRIIASYIATHPIPFAISVTGASVYAAATVATTVVLGRVTDRVLVPAFKGRLTVGALVVKTLGREDAEVQRLRDKAEALRNERIHMGWLRAAFEPSFEAIPALGIVLLIAVGSWRGSSPPLTIRPPVEVVALFPVLALSLRA